MISDGLSVSTESINLKAKSTINCTTGYYNLPEKAGVIPDADRFDAEFFGFPETEAAEKDPLTKKLLETAIEAIIDAGLDPEDLRNSNSAMFVGWCCEDTKNAITKTPDLTRLLSSLNMILADTAIALGFKGPINAYDTACASSFSAFHEAVKCIEAGVCDTAIVAGGTINLSPITAHLFKLLGMISNDGKSKCMDHDANGYCRSEAVVSVLLQKKKDSKRIYAKVLGTNSNNDGFKQEGITFPSVDGQTRLMREVYSKAGVDPASVTYVEAHMTGTQAGDPVECAALCEVLCKNRPTNRPLLVGCLKSNVGHSEGASGVSAVTKSCLVFQKKLIPPNINFTKPNQRIEGLKNGSLKPVTKTTRFEGDFIALNCFGFGGSNAHVILEKNHKKLKKDSFRITNSKSFPRLINLCSRNEKGIETIIRFLKSNPKQVTKDFLALLNDFSKMDHLKMPTRCSIVMNESRQICWMKSNNRRQEHQRLVLFFSDTETSEEPMAINPDLLEIKPFGESIQCSIEYLEQAYGVTNIDSLQMALIYQIALADLVKFLNIKPNQTFGTGSGKMINDYFQATLTKQQVLDAIVNQNIITAKNSINLDKNCLIVEISASRMKSFIDKCKDSVHISLMPSKSTPDKFLRSLGKIYINGHNVSIEKLYPKVQYPVAQETASLSPLVKWNHDKSYYLVRVPEYFSLDFYRIKYTIDLVNPTYKFLSGHVIDGRILFPATGYLWLTREFFLRLEFNQFIGDYGIEFKDVKFNRATILSVNNPAILNVQINQTTGKFSITEGGSECVSGHIRLLSQSEESTESEEKFIRENVKPEDEDTMLSQTDVYKELRICGYDYLGAFQGIQGANMDGTKGRVKWTGHWIAFADCLAQIRGLRSNRELIIPTSIDLLKIDMRTLMRELERDPSQEFEMFFDYEARIGCCKGIMVKGLKGSAITRKFQKVLAEEYNFVPFDEVISRNEHERHGYSRYAKFCSIMAQVIVESVQLDDQLSKEIQKEFNHHSNYSLLKILFDHNVSKLRESFDPLTLAGDFLTSNIESDERIIRNILEIVLENISLTKPFDVVQVTSSARPDEHLFEERRTLGMKTLNFQTLAAKKEDLPNIKNLPCNLIAFRDPNASFEYMAAGKSDPENETQSLSSLEVLTSMAGHLNEGQFIWLLFRTKINEFESWICNHLGIQSPEGTSIQKLLSHAYELGFVKIAMKEDPMTGFVSLLIRKAVTPSIDHQIVNIQTLETNWIPELQSLLKANRESECKKKIWLTSSESNSGIIGFMKCLRKEGEDQVRVIFNRDEKNLLNEELMKMDLTMNVSRDGAIGTYRHKSVADELMTRVPAQDAYLDVETKGDLSSLKYYEMTEEDKMLRTG